jgi:hypothetical protein
MPGQTQPPDDHLRQKLIDLEQRLQAVERQQYSVFTDPRPIGNQGDPSHGNAVVVIGSGKPICGISAFGIFSFKTGSWVQIG